MYRLHEKRQKQETMFRTFFNVDHDIDMTNRWVVLANMMPWVEIEEKFCGLFVRGGKPAYSIRVALGTLIIKEKLNLSDEETVAQITENPYLQYFLGFDQYSTRRPFDPSSLTHFRKRFNSEVMSEINEMIFLASSKSHDKDNDDDESSSGSGGRVEEVEKPELGEPHGDLILDATCTPADIHYPTDITLLNDGREILETVIDVLHQPFIGKHRKPRDYREGARRHFLLFTKQRRPGRKQIRATIRRQLGYVGRDLKIVKNMLEYSSLEHLDHIIYQKLLVVSELYRQQRLMYKQEIHKVEDRIVSIHQPHIRPIVRGKAGADVEFGAKVLISVQNGFSHVERIDFNNFNEGKYLIQSVEAYRDRYGHYPARILADKLFRTRENYRYCKENGIKVSHFKLGRPPKNLSGEQIREERQEEGLRNEVEGKFGTGKRKYTLSRLLTRLPVTTAAQIVLTFLVMNLDKVYRDFLFSFFKVHLFWQTVSLFDPDYVGSQNNAIFQ